MKLSKLANIVLTFTTFYMLNKQIHGDLINNSFIHQQKPKFLSQEFTYYPQYKTGSEFLNSLIKNFEAWNTFYNKITEYGDDNFKTRLDPFNIKITLRINL